MSEVDGQLRLGDPIPPPMVRRDDPPTSKDAAVRVKRGRLRQMVLAAFQVHSDHTGDGLAQRHPGENPPSLRKRRTGLATEGILGDTGRSRPTLRGCQAIVFSLDRGAHG